MYTMSASSGAEIASRNLRHWPASAKVCPHTFAPPVTAKQPAPLAPIQRMSEGTGSQVHALLRSGAFSSKADSAAVAAVSVEPASEIQVHTLAP